MQTSVFSQHLCQGTYLNSRDTDASLPVSFAEIGNLSEMLLESLGHLGIFLLPYFDVSLYIRVLPHCKNFLQSPFLARYLDTPFNLEPVHVCGYGNVHVLRFRYFREFQNLAFRPFHEV